jgi:hypothetical protein
MVDDEDDEVEGLMGGMDGEWGSGLSAIGTIRNW